MGMLLIGSLGLPEIALIVGAIILLFGGRKIPELMRGIGKGIREFNTAKATIKSEIEEGIKDAEKLEGTESEADSTENA